MHIISFMFLLLNILIHSFETSVINDEDQAININRPEHMYDVEEIDQGSDVEKTVEDEWKGRYFPNKLFSSHSSSDSIFSDRNILRSLSPDCDDGNKNLSVDWNDSVFNHTCFFKTYNPDNTISPIIHQDIIPWAYEGPHICIKNNIDYSSAMITYGSHRPLWARFGEYKFIPRQRWLHNAENGAVIMLYHPCAHPLLINQLRKLVTSCLRQHIITPYNLLPENRPLALFTWGWYLNMNVVNPELVVQFIKNHAFRAPKNITIDDGRYDYLLMQHVSAVSDSQDFKLCLNFNEE